MGVEIVWVDLRPLGVEPPGFTVRTVFDAVAPRYETASAILMTPTQLRRWIELADWPASVNFPSILGLPIRTRENG